MLDIRWIREHAEEAQRSAELRGMKLSIAELLERDARKRALVRETELLRETRNRLSEDIGRLMQRRGEGADTAAEAKAKAETLKAESQAIGRRLAQLDDELRLAEAAFAELHGRVPNRISDDTPIGRSDADNVELKRVGEPADFGFEPRDHMALGELHGMIDVARGVKTSGSRHYYLKGAGALLHRAVQQMALDVLLERGFEPMEVPLLVRPIAMQHTGYFPQGRDNSYKLEDEEAYLAGTSEVPLVAYYAGEMVNVDVPIRLAAASMCFRSEVGSAGRDVHGLYRVHQFAKVEQVVLCRGDEEESERLLQEITANAERLLQLLELPYRQVAVCTGDMVHKTFKQYDLETWMPSRRSYGETHSSSNLLDYQARRANIRYRGEDGSLKYCHTLNNTAVATPRILIPLLENHQREDGTIRIPEALRPYLNGLAELVPPGGTGH